MKLLCANRIAPDGAASHWGYAVCLCPIKGTPGLNELMIVFLGLVWRKWVLKSVLSVNAFVLVMLQQKQISHSLEL